MNGELTTFGRGLPRYTREVQFSVNPGLYVQLEATLAATSLGEENTAYAVLVVNGRSYEASVTSQGECICN